MKVLVILTMPDKTEYGKHHTRKEAKASVKTLREADGGKTQFYIIERTYFFIQRRAKNNRFILTTVDMSDVYADAKRLRDEYAAQDKTGDFYLSGKCCRHWTEEHFPAKKRQPRPILNAGYESVVQQF